MFTSISAQPQGRTTGYLWIFRSTMKLRFQRIKNQVNRRFLQADMAELPKVARSEIFWTACKSGNKTAIAPSFGLRLRWMSTRWKDNFIKFSVEQYFDICCVMYTAATRWEQDSGDEDDTTKRSMGNASIGPHEMKFRSLEQNKDPKSIGKRRHKLATSDARRC
jgi:C1A family cysteine protease